MNIGIIFFIFELPVTGAALIELSSINAAPIRPLKIFQLLRRFKKFKLSRMSKYASTLNFFCSLHLEFLNGLLN